MKAAMRIRVLFFGALKDLVGRGADEVSLPETATVGDVLAHYERQAPRLRQYAASLALSVNQEYVGPTARLREGDEVALLPPVSGGSGKARSACGTGESPVSATNVMPLVKIVRERIVPHDIVPALERPEDGAIV